MKRVLDPLLSVPGVRRAVLISRDGVPITQIEVGDAARLDKPGAWSDSTNAPSAFAGMATGLLAEIHRLVDPLSWDAPRRVVLRAARGTLILVVTERATVAVELERGMAAEELRLPMESVVVRLRRTLERSSQASRAGSRALRGDQTPEVVVRDDDGMNEPPGLLPGASEESDAGSDSSASFGTEVPNTTTES